jgi:hypothetical protein
MGGDQMKFATFTDMNGRHVYINPKRVTKIVQKFEKGTEVHLIGGQPVEIELPAAQVVEDIEKASETD